jgi:hypothetical protein
VILALLALASPVLVGLVVGLPIFLAVVGLLLVRARAPHTQLQPHHDVAGYIYAGLAVLYAVLLAFVVIVVWGQYNATETRVRQEAEPLGDLLRQAQIFLKPVPQAIGAAVRTYARAVIEDEWPTMAQGRESPMARQAYESLWQATRTVAPHTPAEVNWHAAMLRSLTTLSDDRRNRLGDSQEPLSPVLWVTLISGAMINIGYSYLFGVRSLIVHLIITAALTAMTTLVLFVILLMDLPFVGCLRVNPGPFVQLLQSLDQQVPQATEGALRGG